MFDYGSMFDLTGKTALVVGAGSGIGEAGAHGLAAFGARVFCADANVEAAEERRRGDRGRGGGGAGAGHARCRERPGGGRAGEGAGRAG